MDDNSTTLIPTRHREHLPKGLSHPVGAEILSKDLHDIPQWGDIELWFGGCSPSAYVNDHCSHHVQLNAQFESFRQVVTVRNKSSYQSEYLSRPEWALHAWAIPSVDRHSVRQLLLNFGIEELRNWLKKRHTATELDAGVEFIIGYATDPSRLCFIDKVGVASANVQIREEQHFVVNETSTESLSK